MLAKNIYSAREIFQSKMPESWKEKELKKTMNFYCEPRGDRKMKDKLSIADIYMDRLNIKGYMKDQVLHIVKVSDLKKLHGTASQEQTIALICFYVMRKHNKKVKLNEYKLFNELKLTTDLVNTFLVNLCSSMQLNPTKYYKIF